jgi:hypothetical protein
MESWDRERRARRFAVGWVLVLVGIVFVCVVPQPLVRFGFGGMLLAAGIALIGWAG